MQSSEAKTQNPSGLRHCPGRSGTPAKLLHTRVLACENLGLQPVWRMSTLVVSNFSMSRCAKMIGSGTVSKISQEPASVSFDYLAQPIFD